MTDSDPPLHVALLTPRGRGAVATIRLVGDASQLDGLPFQAANRRPISAQRLQRIFFGHWGKFAQEDVVGCRCDEQTAEFHCHGGDAAVMRILQDCRSAGAIVVSWQELLLRSTDIITAELQDALSRTITWRTTEWLLRQLDGRLQSTFETLNKISWSAADRQHAAVRLQDLLQWTDFGLHLTEPYRVVLTGPPNVGKSSLMNALLGYDRSIVFDQPGTTRDLITAVSAFDGWAVELTDTAGLRDARASLEAEGILRAKERIATADLVLQIVDRHDVPVALMPRGPKEILVATKCDLTDGWGDRLPPDALRVSSQTAEGLEELQTAIAQRLVPRLPEEQTPLPVTARHVELLHAMWHAIQSENESAYRAASAALLSPELLSSLPFAPGGGRQSDP